MAGARSEGRDWYLGDAEEQHRAHPRSFFIPGREERESLEPGAVTRLLFFLREPGEGDPQAERMWLEVRSGEAGRYVGVLMNRPVAIGDLAQHDLVAFGAEHVIAVQSPRWAPFEGKRAFVSRRLLEDDDLEPGAVFHDTADERLRPLEDGTTSSGWSLLAGDETEREREDTAKVALPDLAG